MFVQLRLESSLILLSHRLPRASPPPSQAHRRIHEAAACLEGWSATWSRHALTGGFTTLQVRDSTRWSIPPILRS